MTTAGSPVDDPLGESGDALPAPGTDEGWAALAAEAASHGYPDPQSYVAAYQAGHVNVGFAGYQPGNPHTGFGQLQAYDRAAGEAGVPLGEYAEMHTPEALAAARGETPPGVDHPFTPPANFTADGHPIEYGPDGTGIVTNDHRELPDGVDHYDRYTGEPLDAEGHIVPGVANAGDGYAFSSARDQRIGLDEHGRLDPEEIDRLEAGAREHGRATVSDDIAATTRPFPGHPLSDTGAYARPVVGPGQPPIAYSGPDGTYVIAGDGMVLTGEPGRELLYEGEHGSAVVGADGRVITTDEHGRITVTEPAVEYREEHQAFLPEDDLVQNILHERLDVDDPDFPRDAGLDDEDPPAGEDHGLDEGFGPGGPATDDAGPAAPDADGTFGHGAPDPRVTTTADDLRPSDDPDDASGPGSGADPDPRDEDLSSGADHDLDTAGHHGSGEDGSDHGSDGGPDDSSDHDSDHGADAQLDPA
ncbi:hypothetical protein [Actinomycetospora soli]|uniref:hypothetical protein n=1 Tax=Actinomycetospora soli TaxID=2893887 RepID=UPI001E2AB0A2|nr:hypothetical protein [Actinomycetospora soli]MCD2188613.1 hypothetical protein [Actinomycetospora soli]